MMSDVLTFFSPAFGQDREKQAEKQTNWSARTSSWLLKLPFLHPGFFG